MQKKKIQYWLPLLFAIVMVIGMAIGYELRDKTRGQSFFAMPQNSSLQELEKLIETRYVDAVAMDSIHQLAVTALLSHLDPHSVFIPARDLQVVNEDLQGNFQGIGIVYQIINDTVHAVNVTKDGPADKAGMQVGDRLIKVNDTISLTGKQAVPQKIQNELRGKAGTQVKVTALRNGQPINITIKRGMIPLPSVDVSYMITPIIGFIRINKFGDRTYEEFMQSLEQLQKKGMQELILDLRGNGGGLLKEAVAIADEFLSEDKLIVYTEGAHLTRMEHRCKRDGIFEKGKLVVLIDETSASASEVLSGALQDWDRATIVGRRSFGKGLVQQQYQLSDGSAVRLTIARYYSPLGRNIQKPYNQGNRVYETELMNRYHNGEMVHADTATPSGKIYTTPAGKKLYGGGGIAPDVFVPMDAIQSDTTLYALHANNILGQFGYQLYLQRKIFFDALTSPDALQKEFVAGDAEWRQLTALAARDSIRLNQVSPQIKKELLSRFTTVMARQIWRAKGFYQLSNQTDATVQKAIDLLK